MKLQDKVDRFVNPLMRGIKGLKWERRPMKKKNAATIHSKFIQRTYYDPRKEPTQPTFTCSKLTTKH